MDKYETPVVTDYGTLKDLTASDRIPITSDVPQGTPANGDPSSVVGSDDNLS